MKRAALLVVAVLLLFAGHAIGQWFADAPQTLVHTITRTVAPDEYTELLEDYELEPGGLRGWIEGIEARAPDTITKTDTLITPPDTVLRFVTLDSRGRLAVERLTRAPDSVATDSTTAAADSTLYAPELLTGIDVSDCDEGYHVQNDGTVVCDRARLGHLYLVPRAGLFSAAPGIDWEPSYRSPWQFSAAYVFPYDRTQPDRLDVWVGRRVQLW